MANIENKSSQSSSHDWEFPKEKQIIDSNFNILGCFGTLVTTLSCQIQTLLFHFFLQTQFIWLSSEKKLDQNHE